MQYQDFSSDENSVFIFIFHTCEDTTVVMTTSVSANRKLPSQHRALFFSFTNQSSAKT